MKDTKTFLTECMSKHLNHSFFIFLLLCVAVNLPVHAAEKEVRLNDKQIANYAKKKGFKIIQSIYDDFDGDAKLEYVAICRNDDKELSLCVFAPKKSGVMLVKNVSLDEGKELKSLKKVQMINDVYPSIIIEYQGDTPQEIVKVIQIYTLNEGGKTLHRLFMRKNYRNKDPSQHPKWERLNGLIEYGDARHGWYVEDTNDDGVMEVIIKSKEKIFPVKVNKSQKKNFVIGVYEKIFVLEGDALLGKYVDSGEKRFKNFMPEHKVKDVTASSAFIPKSELKELKADLLAKALSENKDEKGKKNEKVPEEIVVDRAPFIKTVADKDLTTSWVEDTKGDGEGEWIELDLGKVQEIHSLRFVPGCVDTKSEYRAHNVPYKFKIYFDESEHAFLNLKNRDNPITLVKAIQKRKLSGKRFAKQYIVFLDNTVKAQRIKIQLMESKRQGRKNRSCISEIGVY